MVKHKLVVCFLWLQNLTSLWRVLNRDIKPCTKMYRNVFTQKNEKEIRENYSEFRFSVLNIHVKDYHQKYHKNIFF